MSDADFLRGFAIAMRELIKEFDQPTMAKDIITSNGLKLEDFEGIDLPEGDLEAIRPLWPHKQAAPRKKRLKLSELLAQCDPKAGGEIDFDAPVGKETR
jgi:hypothetical protein